MALTALERVDYSSLMFTPLQLKRLSLPHRIIRAATFENMAGADGRASQRHADLYVALARGEVGTIITGFNYVSLEGRAAQPFQAGIDTDDKIDPWKKVIDQAKTANPRTKIILQIAHTGRQTIREVTGRPVVGAGPIRCLYFLSRVRTLREKDIPARIDAFVAAALRAEKAGFDGVQVHAAHGYLIHQFLSPFTNRRRDRYGADRMLFLKEVLQGIREKSDIPILLKLSAAEDRPTGITVPLMKSYLQEIDRHEVDAVEISYGTMELPLNIIRGGHPLEPVLRHNYLFNRWGEVFKTLFRHLLYPIYRNLLLPYADLYNLKNAVELRQGLQTPLLVTGGIRQKSQIKDILEGQNLDGVTLSRPFVCEPDLVKKLMEHQEYRSKCSSCNLCTVMCDSPNPLQCYLGKAKECSL